MLNEEFSSVQFSSVTQSCLTLRPHGLQHGRPPCPSPPPGAYSNSCPSSRWCHPTIPPPALNLPSIRVFSNQSVLHIRWPKYWSFSFNISPSNEHPGLISFRMDWLDLLAVQGTRNSNENKCWGRQTGNCITAGEKIAQLLLVSLAVPQC